MKLPVRRQKDILFVMRLAEMARVHPDQIESVCCKCLHPVGIYPSGQNVIKKLGADQVEIICSHCQSPAGAKLAPGARNEPSQSRWRT